MKRRALVGALSIAFLIPLMSAVCVQCIGGECSMGQKESPAPVVAPCHATPSQSGSALTSPAYECCQMEMGPAALATAAQIEVAPLGSHVELGLGNEALVAPWLNLSLDDSHPPPSRQGLSRPLFTLHSSLLL